ncbi:MAG: hypothetical protein BWY28_02882 [bacterium ADurb.Bin236]|nr:MAG: hypothetical protein BWY28_02882 [bacterium ADurb.Bin236]
MRSADLSGQPRVDSGHSPELNHVSSTSLCWAKSFEPHFGHASMSSIEHERVPQEPQSHTGIRWPHHNCLDMHQSRMFSSQSRYTLVQRSGTKRVLPSFTASIAGPASSFILTNHCRLKYGSTAL